MILVRLGSLSHVTCSSSLSPDFIILLPDKLLRVEKRAVRGSVHLVHHCKTQVRRRLRRSRVRIPLVSVSVCKFCMSVVDTLTLHFSFIFTGSGVPIPGCLLTGTWVPFPGCFFMGFWVPFPGCFPFFSSSFNFSVVSIVANELSTAPPWTLSLSLALSTGSS